MPFVNRILQFNSLSIAGLAKNTGKTVCLNYVLDRLAQEGKVPAVTSIGIDGEGVDQVTATPKPDIRLNPGVYFTTAAHFYRQKRFLAEVCAVSERETVLGPWVTARALEAGKVVLGGPSDMGALQQWIRQTPQQFQVDLCVVDGALSRMSLASPAVTEAMVLATGAAYSANKAQLVRRTRFVYDTLSLPQVDAALGARLVPLQQGIWGVSADGREVVDTHVASALHSQQLAQAIQAGGRRLYVAGAVGGMVLKALSQQAHPEDTELIIRDFSRLFVEPHDFYAFLKKGGQITQVLRTCLIAVCINPWSPEGYLMDALTLEKEMQEALPVPVYNIKHLAK